MKIVAVDNFNRETVDDRLVAEHIQSALEAELMVEALNASVRSGGPVYFRLAPDDYVLYRFQP